VTRSNTSFLKSIFIASDRYFHFSVRICWMQDLLSQHSFILYPSVVDWWVNIKSIILNWHLSNVATNFEVMQLFFGAPRTAQVSGCVFSILVFWFYFESMFKTEMENGLIPKKRVGYFTHRFSFSVALSCTLFSLSDSFLICYNKIN